LPGGSGDGSPFCSPRLRTHLLRDLKDLYEFEPGKQDWAEQMAAFLIEARDADRNPRAARKKTPLRSLFNGSPWMHPASNPPDKTAVPPAPQLN
jgi:hypothetical protein